MPLCLQHGFAAEIRSWGLAGLVALWACLLFVACSSDSQPPAGELSYYGRTKAIIDAKCVTCHSAGNIGPFALSSIDKVREHLPAIRFAVDSGEMPPWKPDNACAEYLYDFSLSAAEKQTLLDWIDGGAIEGQPNGAKDPPAGFAPPPEVRYDLQLTMPEPYTPTRAPDDYRCFLIDWKQASDKYVTAFEVKPGRRDQVHHVIAFAATGAAIETFRKLDAAEAGPGYTCFGSPGGGFGTDNDVKWIATWVPGAFGGELPADTGVLIKQDALIILQVHYNTLTASAEPDQTSLQFRLADDVRRPAAVLPFADLRWLSGDMAIPKDDADVSHSYEFALSQSVLLYLAALVGDNTLNGLRVHAMGLHMHTLGRSGEIVAKHGDGSETCLLRVPNWDFHWQGVYPLKQSVPLAPDDVLRLRCSWDNSPANQPIVGGKRQTSRDVNWGDGTQDEMCLGVAYITRR